MIKILQAETQELWEEAEGARRAFGNASGAYRAALAAYDAVLNVTERAMREESVAQNRIVLALQDRESRAWAMLGVLESMGKASTRLYFQARSQWCALYDALQDAKALLS